MEYSQAERAFVHLGRIVTIQYSQLVAKFLEHSCFPAGAGLFNICCKDVL
jgi:hypothetical protein